MCLILAVLHCSMCMGCAWDGGRCSLSVASPHSLCVLPLPLFSVPQLPNFPPYPLSQQQKAISLLLSNTTRCLLGQEGLIPGSSYIARVRARPGRASSFSGQFSEWSTEASWQTPEGSVGQARAVQGCKCWPRSPSFSVTVLSLIFSEGSLQPRNLRCLFNGEDRLTCSWEVKKAVTTSVLFALFFRATPESVYVLCSWQYACPSPVEFLLCPGFPDLSSTSSFCPQRRGVLTCAGEGFAAGAICDPEL